MTPFVRKSKCWRDLRQPTAVAGVLTAAILSSLLIVPLAQAQFALQAHAQAQFITGLWSAPSRELIKHFELSSGVSREDATTISNPVFSDKCAHITWQLQAAVAQGFDGASLALLREQEVIAQTSLDMVETSRVYQLTLPAELDISSSAKYTLAVSSGSPEQLVQVAGSLYAVECLEIAQEPEISLETPELKVEAEHIYLPEFEKHSLESAVTAYVAQIYIEGGSEMRGEYAVTKNMPNFPVLKSSLLSKSDLARTAFEPALIEIEDLPPGEYRLEVHSVSTRGTKHLLRSANFCTGACDKLY